MTLVSESTKSYTIFLEIATDTLNKSLERQLRACKFCLTQSRHRYLASSHFSLYLEFLRNSLKIFSFLVFYTPVVQELKVTFVYH